MYNSPIAVYKGIRAEFSKQLGVMAGPVFKPFVQTVNSDTLQEDFRFKDAMGNITEWKGKRIPGQDWWKKGLFEILRFYNSSYFIRRLIYGGLSARNTPPAPAGQ